MIDDNYYMKKTKKVCPMCIFYVGSIPIESIKLCLTHRNKESSNVWITQNEELILKCLSCGVQAPRTNFKHLSKCKATIQKGTEFMTEEQARNYQPLGLVGKIPWKKGGWRAITKEKKDE